MRFYSCPTFLSAFFVLSLITSWASFIFLTLPFKPFTFVIISSTITYILSSTSFHLPICYLSSSKFSVSLSSELAFSWIASLFSSISCKTTSMYWYVWPSSRSGLLLLLCFLQHHRFIYPRYLSIIARNFRLFFAFSLGFKEGLST
jgi:hypothetical protein